MNPRISDTVKRYSMAEIANAVGISKQAAQKRANKEGWKSEKVGRGQKYGADSLPKDVRDALQQRAIAAVLPVIAQEIAAPIVLQAQELTLTDKQRLERDARMGVKAAIRRTQAESACSQEAALHTLLANARAGRLDPVTTNLLRLARDPRGRPGDEFPSIRTLNEEVFSERRHRFTS